MRVERSDVSDVKRKLQQLKRDRDDKEAEVRENDHLIPKSKNIGAVRLKKNL